jgi:hypothetical protein
MDSNFNRDITKGFELFYKGIATAEMHLDVLLLFSTI